VTQAPGTEPFAEMSFAAYLEIARRRKWWIILTPLGLFIAMTIFAHRLPNIFRAETVVLVDSAQVPDKYVPTISTGDIAGRLTTLQQQVLSPSRLKRLVEAEGLYPDPTGERTEEEVIHSVQKSISVDAANQAPGKTSTFRIVYSGPRRLEVARIANRLAEMFIEENTRVRVDQTKDTAQFLKDQLQVTKQQLDEKQAQLRDIQSHNVLEMPESKPYHMETLANLRAQAQAIQDKIQQDEREKSILQSMMLSTNSAPTVDVDGLPKEEGAAGGNQTELLKLETKLSQLKSRYGPQHPDVRKTQAEIDKLKAKEASEASSPEQQVEVVSTAPKRRNPVLEAQIQKLSEEIQGQSVLLKPLQDRMEFHENKLQQMPVFEQQIARLQSENEILKTQYTGLLNNEKAAELSQALEIHQKGEKFEVLDAAVTPTLPAAPNRLLYSVGGLIGGLLFGIAMAAMTELNDESVRTESEAMGIFGKPVLTGIPRIISSEERRSRRWRATGLITGTLAGSVGMGFLLSIVSQRFL
jgi:succinoglycan biosynthesis transport protein ExoP